MNKITTGILVIPFLLAACQTKCVEDSGISATKELPVKPYDEIKVSGAVKLILRQDSSFKLNIQADSNAIGLVKASVSGHELSLKMDPEKYCGTDSVIVTAGIGDLNKITAGEGVRVYTASKIIVNDITLNLSGSTRINLDMNAAKLKLNNDGAASINLSGQAGASELTSKGSISLNAFGFVTGINKLDIEGAGKARINVLNDLKVRTSGATEIYYRGNPKVDEKKTGVAKLEKVN
jgi:hypothetical protein